MTYKGEPRWVEELREVDERIRRNELRKGDPTVIWSVMFALGLIAGAILIIKFPL